MGKKAGGEIFSGRVDEFLVAPPSFCVTGSEVQGTKQRILSVAQPSSGWLVTLLKRII